MILQEARGAITGNAFRAYLLERDRRMNLEYDIAWANQFLINHLLAVFPDAKFIVLIRDCYTWLQSIVGHLVSREIPIDVRDILDWWFKPERYPHTRHDRTLKEHGLYSVGAFLNAWNRHINSCTELIPPDRRLILRTHELNQSHQRLAEFLQIPVEGLDARNGHINRGTASIRIQSMIEGEYLNEMVGSVCGETMAHYFPEVAGVDDIYRLWSEFSET